MTIQRLHGAPLIRDTSRSPCVVHCPAAMKHRLRIAASVFFAVVTVALCVLWVRSYWRGDVLFLADPFTNRRVYLASIRGELRAERTQGASQNIGLRTGFNPRPSYSNISAKSDPDLPAPPTILGFRFPNPKFTPIPIVPHWFAVAVFGTLAVTIWPRSALCRFSIRTLLIATTLVAVVLGLVCYTIR